MENLKGKAGIYKIENIKNNKYADYHWQYYEDYLKSQEQEDS